MGMFDRVNFETTCPNCEQRVGGFQTKSRANVLEQLSPIGLESFYASCDRCGLWLEFRWNNETDSAELHVEALLIHNAREIRLLREQLFALCGQLHVRVDSLLSEKGKG